VQVRISILLLFEFADLDAFLVLARLQLFGLRNRRPALGIQGAEPIQTNRAATGREPFRDTLEITPEKIEIVHVLPC